MIQAPVILERFKRCHRMRLALSPKLCLPRYIPLKPSSARPIPLFQQQPRFLPLRHLTYTTHLRQNDSARQQKTQGQLQLHPEQSESIKPESYQASSKAKPAEAPKTDALLAEQTVSNKEQRRADWIIIKEMAKYIWPKVWLAFSPEWRQRPNKTPRMTSEQKSG